MSREKLQRDAERWYRQGLDDLDAAQALLMAEKFAQACFYAQQAAEKGLKAIWIILDREAPSHVLRAMHLPEPAIAGALRIGLGKFTTETEIVQASALINESVSEISRLLETV